MISRELAMALREAGLPWKPAAGDRFVIPQPELDGELFTLSEMTIEPREYPTGTVLGFNGTTEWALDSVSKDDALWMPREDQLRELLGGTFVSLTTASGAAHAAADGRFIVTARTPSGEERAYPASSAADAYGYALLALVEHAMAS